MSDNGYYPSGAGRDLPEIEIDICTSQSLSKNTSIHTSNYILEGYTNEHPDIDLSDTDIKGEYEREHYTIEQLLSLLKEYLTKDLIYGDSKMSKKELQSLIQECEGWTVDEVWVGKN